MSMMIGEYLVESNRAIGTGTFASVLKAVHQKTRRPAAIKVMPKYRHNRLDASPVNEIEALLHLKDVQGVIALYDVYDDEENYYAALEYVPGTLLGFVTSYGALSEEGARLVFRQLAEIVDGCHKKGFAHRDIKLENILFNPRTGTIRLIDFGMCARFKEDRHNLSSDVIGSPGYIAPEILSSNINSYNGIKSDIYSLGVVLYALLFGLFPFADKDNLSYYNNRYLKSPEMSSLGFTPRNKIRAVPTRPSLCFPGEVSLEARSLLHHMLTTDFAKRATFAEIRQHPFYQHRELDPNLFEQRRPSFTSPLNSPLRKVEEQQPEAEEEEEEEEECSSDSCDSVILEQEKAALNTSHYKEEPSSSSSSSFPQNSKRRQSRVRFAIDDEEGGSFSSSFTSSSTSSSIIMMSLESLDPSDSQRASKPPSSRRAPVRPPSLLPRRNSSVAKEISWDTSSSFVDSSPSLSSFSRCQDDVYTPTEPSSCLRQANAPVL